MARIQTSGLGGSTSGISGANLDGGGPADVYLNPSQMLNGGSSSSTYTANDVLDGGNSSLVITVGT